MGYLPLILFLLPLLAALLSSFRSASAVLLSGLFALIQLILAGLSMYFVFIESETLGEVNAWLRLDPMSAFFLFCLSLFAVAGVSYEQAHWSMLTVEADPFDNQVKLRRLLWLWAAANALVLVYGLLLLWLGFVLLLLCLAVLFQSDDEEMKRLSLHAWVSLSLALIGCALYFWAMTKAGSTERLFSFDSILREASSLDDSLMLAGTFFLFVGFGFFAGVWPAQDLLLSSYQKLSAPKSFFYATALWMASLYALLRVLGLCAKATGFDALHPMLLLFGALTALTSIAALRREDNIKAFLGHVMTYHTGILLFMLGFASRFTAQTVIFSLFFTALSHGLLWLSIGAASTPKGALVFSSLRVAQPGTRRLLLLALAVCLGLPPLGTFLSQWISVQALATEHHQWYANEKSSGLLGSLWMVVLYWRLWLWMACSGLFLVVVSRVLLGLLLRPSDEPPTKPSPRSVHYVFGALFLIILGLGLFIPEAIDELFDQVACQVVGEWSGAL